MAHQCFHEINLHKRFRRFHAFATVLCSLLYLSACSENNMGGMEPPIELPDLSMPPPQLESARFLLLRSARWPGGGRELTLGVLQDPKGVAFEQDLAAQIVADVPVGVTLNVKSKRMTLAPGYTAILLPDRQTAAERVVLSSAILAFVASRPSTERIALYRHGATVQMFSNFLLDRIKLTEALDRYQKGTDGDANPLPSLQAVGPVASDVRDVGGVGPDVMRSIVILSNDAPNVFTGYSQVYAISVPPTAAGLTSASAAIDHVRQNAFYKVAACGSDEKIKAKLHMQGLLGDTEATFGDTLPEEIGAGCQADVILSGNRTYTPRIELVFNDAQRAAHATRITATQAATFNEPLARSDFETQVRLAPGQPTVLALAHLHGQSSLRCERKSYTIQLTGPVRYLLPDSAADEYTLISMCDDLAYVYAPTAFALFGEDLSPLKRRYVELVVDGQTRGIYLLFEKSREELVRDNGRTQSVMRRQYPVGTNDVFEVLYDIKDDLLAPAARWRTFITQITPLVGDPLVAALREQMDLDHYLRYLAYQSIFRSGDYIDELYFYGVEQANGLGGTTETYRVMAWDPEGYSTCHSNGANSFQDVNNMVYCAEGRLDFKILADAKIYALFVQKLEETINGALARDRFVAQLDQTKTELQGRLMVPAICAAMTELQKINAGAADCAIARSVIEARASAILAAYDARRTYLLMQIATYRAK